MSLNNGKQLLGKEGERIAERYLLKKGYKLVERNYRCPSGELDLIVLDRRVVVFVEVKSRRSAEYGSPDRAIDSAKQANITRAARSYATRAGIPWNQVRFDTVSIIFTEPPSIVHNQDAFFEGRSL